MQDNDLPQIGTPMQTDETRAREVLGATKHADDCAMLTALHTDYCDCDRAIRAMLAFAAPPAVERALHPALSLIEAIAKWERENGTLAAIMPSEYGDFCRLMADAAVHGSARAVTLHPSDREAIARVIDPKAWKRRQQHLDNISEAHWRSNHPNEGIALGMRRAGLVIADEVVASSLTKADAVLALSGSLAPANPTEKGE